MSNIHRNSRRDFLKVAGAAFAAPYVITTAALGNDERPPASERVTMAGIGIGNMGRGDQVGFLNDPEIQYVAVCDVRKSACEDGKKRTDTHRLYNNNDCVTYADFRDVLARTDIDMVHIDTPDHWHAIMVIEACRAGKDVYCQKPETLTLREGPMMIAAARRYNRVVTGGSQRVLEDYKEIVNKIWGGELGTIKEINVIVEPLSQPCNLPAQPVPDDIDWEMWLGPAPWAPYNAARCDGNFGTSGGSWRSYIDYSGGGMTDWGAHHFGGALFAADVRDLQPTDVIYHDNKEGKYLTFVYPNGLLVHHNKPGMKNHEVIGTPGETLPPKAVPRYKDKRGFQEDFLYCVLHREKPFRDIEYAVNTMVVPHLGIIAYQLQRSLKWDPAKQEFPGDEEANRFLDRARREPWQL